MQSLDCGRILLDDVTRMREIEIILLQEVRSRPTKEWIGIIGRASTEMQ